MSSPQVRLFLAAFAGSRDTKALIEFCSKLLRSRELTKDGIEASVEKSILSQRAKTLVAFCLDAIATLSEELSQPSSSSTSVLCDTVVILVNLFPQILLRMVNLISTLRQLLMSIKSRDENQVLSLSESFATRMTVCCFSAGVFSQTPFSLLQLLSVPDLFLRAQSFLPLAKPIARAVGSAVSQAACDGKLGIKWLPFAITNSREVLQHNLISCVSTLSTPNDSPSLSALSGIVILLRLLSLTPKQAKEDEMRVDDDLNISKILWQDKKLLVKLTTALLPLPSEPNFSIMADSKSMGAKVLCSYLCEMATTSRVDAALRLPYLSYSLNLVPRLHFNISFLDQPGSLNPLLLFSQTFLQHITYSELNDFVKEQRPLIFSELPSAILMMKEFLSSSLWQPSAQSEHLSTSNSFLLGPDLSLDAVVEAVSTLFKKLYERNCVQPFVSETVFHSTAIPSEQFFSSAVAALSRDSDLLTDDIGLLSSPDDKVKALKVLKVCPCLVPFRTRARIFSSVVEGERMTHYEAQNAAQMMRLERAWAMEQAALDLDDDHDEHRVSIRRQMDRLAPSFIPIRRGSVFDDGFKSLGGLKGGQSDLKSRIRVQFIDANGDAEAGIDGGGLFKDFVEECLSEGFSNPKLFSFNSENEIFPNIDLPTEPARREEHLAMLHFLGKMTGKAVWEGILINARFAHFFLKHLAQAPCDVNDLASFDKEIAKNLLHLRNLSADQFEGLGLFFTTNEGRELMPGGRTISVTHSNTSEYILRLSHFLLHGRTELPFRSFLSGFYSVIKPALTVMFLPSELQLLVGGSESELDLEDLKRSVNYDGGYYEAHPIIDIFWAAVTSFSDDERRALVKFITSSSRAPLLGFNSLHPRISIVMSGGVLDRQSIERLPTAATCMNLLKLPPYPQVSMMRDKLLLAITSGAGFDLS